MIFWKRILFLFSLFVLLLGALWLPFRTPLLERFSVLKNGWGDRVYLWASEGENGLLCAASRDGAGRVVSAERSDDGLELRFFNRQGKVLDDWSAPLPRAALDGELCALYPADRNTAFLAFWQADDQGSQSLCVYRAEKGSVPETLLSQKGSGSSPLAQRESIRISAFSRSLDQVLFVIVQEEHAASYACPVTGGGVEKQSEQVQDGIVSAAALPDGSIAIGGDGFLLVPGRSDAGVSAGQSLSHLTCTSSGLYFVEGRSITVWFSDLTGISAQRLFSLSGAVRGHRLSSLSLTTAGDALLLLDGHTLSLVREGGVTDLTAALYPDRTNSLLALCFYLFGAGFLAFLIWEILSVVSRSRIPLSLYWGTVLLALALATGTAIHIRTLRPAGERETLKHRSELFGAVAGLALREADEDAVSRSEDAADNAHGFNSEFLSVRAEALLSDAGAENTRNFHAVAAYKDGQAWFLQDGTRAELYPWFYPVLAERAETVHGAAFQDGERFWYCRVWAGNALCVSTDFAQGEDTALMPSVRHGALAWGSVFTAAFLMILLLVNLDVRRLADGLERYAANRSWTFLRLRSGDELEGMAASLNALAQGRSEETAKRDELVASYRRFVPEPVISLLGKRSILEVDKESFAVRRMTVMAVSFTFPKSVYAETRLLFESVNQTIERTASIAAQKGGTVFNFDYDGYNVILEDADQAVSAAVAIGQETLALNERRMMDGLPAVTLRTALDIGSVVIGIVGDGTHLEQTTIFSRFETLQSFLRLCEKLDANILCTENVAAAASGFASRYIGKCRSGEEVQRVYEIFDADPYDTRIQKASSLHQFSQAVLRLYSGDTAGAKRTFLKLAHETPNDGGARYYLYLADRLEQNPDQPCELNGD